MNDPQDDEPKESTVFQSAPFGKYVLLKKIGKGVMGRVFEAVDTVLNRRVAIKMMAPSDPGGLEGPEIDEERFLREARVSANLTKHPHIVSVYEAGVVEGKRFLAMEFVDGRQMQEWRRGMPILMQLALIRYVALAVHHAHENGIVHRDLKPANVIVDAKDQPHVTDFGLAKALGPEIDRSITTSGLVVGTPAYMSPEQAQGLRAVDARSDVYSLGVMLYEVLTDRHPFEAETAMQLLVKVVEHPPPPPSKVVTLEGHPAREPRLERLCLKALAKRAEDRPQTALAFAEDLSGWLAETVGSRPLPRPRFRPSVPLGILAAVVLMSVLLAGPVWRLLSPGSGPSAAPAPGLSVLEGHTDRVLALAFSPRDRLLVSGGSDRTLKVWDLRTGVATSTLGPHVGKVEALACSPDGRLVAAVTEVSDGVPGEVKLWDLATGLLRAELRGHEDGVNCVAFSPDGTVLATGDRTGQIRLWDVARATVRGSIPQAHGSSIRSLAFTPDGASLASGSWDRTARLWDVGSGRERRVFRGHTEGIWGVSISPDGALLATASSDHTVKLWDLSTGAERRTLAAHAQEVSSVAFSPDGRLLATGGWDRRVKLWEASTGKERTSYAGHEDAVWVVAFSPDGRTLATAGLDRKVRIWSVP